MHAVAESGIVERDGTELRQVGIVLVPARELPRLPADGGVALAPPIRLAVVMQIQFDAVPDAPCDGDLARHGFPSGRPKNRPGEGVDRFCRHDHFAGTWTASHSSPPTLRQAPPSIPKH